MNEIWEFIPTFEDKYSVSDLGRIRRNPYNYKAYHLGKLTEWKLQEKLLGGTKLSNKGYPRVTLEGKQYQIHILVANQCLDNFDNKPQINHIDGNKQNNKVTNLEWVTNQENRDHAVRLNLVANRSNGFCKISESDVIDIIDLCRSGFSQEEIAVQYGLVQQTISKLWKKYSNQSRISNPSVNMYPISGKIR